MSFAALRPLLLATVTSALRFSQLRVQPPAPPQHHWPHALGQVPGQYGVTELVVPRDLTPALAWSWHHPSGRYHTTIAGGPVIDANKSLYLATNDGVWKFAEGGEVLWQYPLPSTYDTSNEPTLYGDAVFGNTDDGFAFALDQRTGLPLWERKVANNTGLDAGYPAVHEGLFVMGAESPFTGNLLVLSLNASNGDKVWEYRPEHMVWNFMPVFPGDGTVLFMDVTGGLYRLGLHNGTEVWHARAPGSAGSFGDGGVILGPNGAAYTCSNPGNGTGQEGQPGVLRAFQLGDGALLWERLLPQPCNSWPAVGRLGPGEELSVVATAGPFMGALVHHGSILAFDAGTGAPRWQYAAPPYSSNYSMAMGDLRGYQERSVFDPKHAICQPAHWSAPTITGDGAVLAGRCDGKLYQVRGPAPGPVGAAPALEPAASGELASSGVSVDTFDAEGASLHGAMALAPGLFAFAACTDTLYVFRI